MKISVIIPVYNAEEFVSQAVESALQFDEVHEVILVEDKSPDNALQVCTQLAEKHTRVRLYQHPDKGNHGAGPSRNLGIEKSTGDFIAFLDADDYFRPTVLMQKENFLRDPKWKAFTEHWGYIIILQKRRSNTIPYLKISLPPFMKDIVQKMFFLDRFICWEVSDFSVLMLLQSAKNH